jgi:hypothetical protein
VLFVDFLGPKETFAATCGALQERVAAVLRVSPPTIVLRRIVVESDYAGVEVGIEFSSDEQLYRYGRRLAEEISTTIRAVAAVDVWVVYRIVPLEHAFLNGAPRRRDGRSLVD